MPLPWKPDLIMAEFKTINDKCASELQLLQQMHTAANMGVPLEKILKMVVDSVRNVLDYTACDIYLLEDDGKSLRLKSISIKMGPLKIAEKLTGLTARNMKIPLYEGSDLLDVITTKKARISEDMTKVFEDFTDNRAIRLLAPKVAAIFGMKAAIRAPLIVKGKVIGIMGVARKSRITDEDLATLQRFASSVALTINKAMAEEDLRAANERLSLEVAARKENEIKLSHSQLRFQHLFENAAVGMVLMDIEGRLVEVNRTLARMLGYDRQEMVGRHFGDFTYPDDLAGNSDLFDELICGKRDSFQMEKRCLTRDNQIVWGHISAALFEMGQDSQRYLVTVIKDITARKHAEETIVESEKRYNLLLDNTDTGFVVVDEKGVVLEANEPYLRFVGAGRLEDIKGRSVIEWTAPECMEDNATAVAQCATQGYIKDFETTYLRPDGSRRVIQIDATVQETSSGKQIHSFCRDITERKMAEEAIFYSQEIFSKAFKSSPLAMVIGDYNTSEIIDTNKQFTEVTGYSREEVVGHTPMELGIVSDEDRNALREVLSKYGFVRNFIIPITTKQGERRILNYFAEPLSMGEEKKILTIAEDVTERRRAERAILESESKFRSYIDNAPSGVFIANANAMFVEVNEAACMTTGYTKDELLSMSAMELTGKDSLENAMNAFRKMEAQDKVTVEYEFIRKDGTTGWWIVDAVKLGTDRFMGFTTDITERKRAEQALQQSEAKFRTIFETSTDNIALSRISDFAFVDVNETFVKTSGYSREELIGKRPADLDLWYNDEDRIKFLKELKEKGEVKNLETRFRMKNGSIYISRFSGSMIYLDGVQHLLSSIYDITEQREIEQKMINSLKEKEALLVKQEIRDRELVASRQQLRNLIIHREELLEEERRHISREIHDEMGQQLTALKMDITRLSDMFTDDQEDLLSLTGSMFSAVANAIKSVQRVSKAIRPVMLDTLGIASAIENEINTFMSTSSLQCKADIDIGDTSLDKTLALSLYRVLQESLTNVARHAEATKVDIVLKRHNGRVVLEITDNGRGITEKELSAPDAYGLIGMRERVNLLDGTLEIIKGQKGTGTKLIVNIPIKDEPDD